MKLNCTKVIVLMAFILLNNIAAKAQETILMMNGNLFFATVKDTAGDYIKMIDPESKKKEIIGIEKRISRR